MPPQRNLLGTFRVVDDLATRIEGSIGGASRESRRFDVASDGLDLGSLAELLVLRAGMRSQGHTLAISGRTRRDEVFGQAFKAGVGGFVCEDGLGVLSVARSGNQAEVLKVNEFVLRLGQAVRASCMPDDAAALLCHVGGELIDNIGEHAGDKFNAFAAFEVSAGRCWLVVADSGRGVLGGYQAAASADASVPQDAVEALEWAVLQHRSRTGDSARGLGFRRLQDVLRRMDAAVRVRSDDASLEVEGASTAAQWLSREQIALQGFVVSAALSW